MRQSSDAGSRHSCTAPAQLVPVPAGYGGASADARIAEDPPSAPPPRRGSTSPRRPTGRTGGWMPSADEIRDGQRTAWAGLSAGWEKWDSIIMDQLGPISAAMIERLDIAPDQQPRDIAAGTGEPGLSIATLAPNGRVVLTDLAPEMLEIAVRRARAQGVDNVETEVCSADDLPFGDTSFD